MKLKVVIFPFVILFLFLEGLAVGHQINAKNKTKTQIKINRQVGAAISKAKAHKTIASKKLSSKVS